MKAKTDPGHLKILEDWLRSYGPDELFDENGAPIQEIARGLPDGRPAHGREPARQRRQAAQGPEAARPGQARARRLRAGPDDRQRADAARRVVRRRLPPQRGRAQLPHRVPGRGGLQPARRGLRGDRPRVGVAARPRDRHRPRARRPDHGGALRAQLPGLAPGLRAHRPPRRVPVLRGVHPDHRRDGQPVLEVPEDVEGGGPVARAAGRPQLPADLGGLAPGPQRLLAPDAGLHQLDAQPQGGHRARVPPAGREHAARDDGEGAQRRRARSTS